MNHRWAWVGPTMIMSLGVAVAGCAPSDTRTPAQVWISEHPTHAGPDGECIEFDDEPCDADPFDLDDLLTGPDRRYPAVSPKTSKPAVKPSAAPKPSVRKTR